MNSKTLLICVIGFLVAFPVFASVYEGSLCTGLNCPVEGTVIAAPTASLAAGTYASNQSVTLTSTGADSIRYTTDGTVPTCASAQYSGAISVTSSKTIKAISCYANNASSTVASFAYTINIPSSGGGGGGGSFTVVASPTPTPTPTVTAPTTQANTNSVISAQDQLKVLMARLQALQNQAGAQSSINSTSGLSFSRNLQVNSQGEDVRQLQIFLNNNGFPVAATGVGSLGRETNFFGNATRAALVKYQTSVGVSATGYLGPLTRAKIAENITPIVSAAKPTPAVTPSPSAATVPSVAFSRPLGAGSEGIDVTLLQNALKNEGFLNVSATGYFGPLTESAVKAFQEKYNIAKSGDSGYGFVGPKTRAKLNELIQ